MTKNARFFDDMARMVGGAVSALGSLKEQVRSEVRERVEEAMDRMDLVPRREFDLAMDMIRKARTEQEQLKKRLAALEGKKSSSGTKGRKGAKA